MTTPAQLPRVVYLPGGSSTGPFAIPFAYAADSEIVVQMVSALTGAATTLANPADYILTDAVGGSLPNGGSIQVNAGSIPVGGWAGASLVIARATPRIQAASMVSQSGFSPPAQEAAFDLLTRIAQDEAATLGQAITAPGGEVPFAIDPLAVRAGKPAVWDGLGGLRSGFAAFSVAATTLVFSSQLLAQAATIAPAAFLITAGHTAAGDGGAALYMQTGVAPTFHSADGQGWRYVAPDAGVNPVAFGADRTGVTLSDTALVAAMAAAAAAGAPVVFAGGAIFAISAPLAVGVAIVGAGMIRPAPGYGANYAVQMLAGGSLTGVTIDGTNLPSPTADWLGVGNPVGCGLIADGSVTAADGWSLVGVTIQNCPNGGSFIRQCNRFLFRDVTALNVQIQTVHVDSGAFESFQCADGTYERCTVNGYTLKGFNMGNGTRVKMDRCHAFGGAQSINNAALYEDGGTDGVWLACSHEGPGFGFKATNSIRCTVIDIALVGSAGGVYAQGFQDFKVIGGNFAAVLASRQALILEGSSAFAAGLGAEIIGFSARRAVVGTTTNHAACQLISVAGFPVSDVTIRDCVFQGMYIGVFNSYLANANLDNIGIDGCTFRGLVSNAVAIYATSATVTENQISGTGGSVAAIFVGQAAGTGAGTAVEIGGNNITGYTGQAIACGDVPLANGAVQWNALSVHDNQASGSANLVTVDFNGNTTDYITRLTIQNNVLEMGAIGGNGILVTLNTTDTTTRLDLRGNALIATDASLMAIDLVNPAGIVGGVEDDNQCSGVTGRPLPLYPYAAAAVPAATIFKVGDRIRNSAPAVGQPKGWLCTVAATTLVSEGNL